MWPSSYEVKSKVPMNFYEKPIYNYKLECHNDPQRNQESLTKLVGDEKQTGSWVAML